MTHPLVRAGSLTALTLLAACADSPAGPHADVSDMDLLGMMLAVSAGAQSVGTTPCTGGGEMIRSGRMDFSQDGDVGTLDFDTTLEFRSCRDVFDQRAFTLDGQSSMTGLVRTRLPAEGPGETLEAEYRQTGTQHWQGDGIDRTCSLDLTTTFDPASGSYRVVGQICGREIQFTLPGGTA